MPMSRWCTGRSVMSLAADMDAARIRHLEARDHAQRRGLAAARRAQQREELAGRDVERHPVDGDDAAVEALGDASRRIEAGEAEGGGGIRPRALANAGAGVTCAARARLVPAGRTCTIERLSPQSLSPTRRVAPQPSSTASISPATKKRALSRS